MERRSWQDIQFLRLAFLHHRFSAEYLIAAGNLSKGRGEAEREKGEGRSSHL